MAKVLSLFSGSLASRVATRVVEQHPDVDGVCLLHFRSPFSREFEDLRRLVKTEWPHAIFRTQSIKKEYRRLVQVTAAGEFSLEQSCYTCRSLLLSKAARYMERVDAEFIVSGELGEGSPLSRAQLKSIGEDLGIGGRILRPLCTHPSRRARGLERWLLDGIAEGKPRSRAAMRKLANRLGLEPIDPMAACQRCKLRTPGFGDRVASLLGEVGFTLNALRLLDFPVFYKVDPDVKIVLARDEWEKRELQNLFLPQDLRVYPATPHGPMMLVRASWGNKARTAQQGVVELAARMAATFAEPGRTETIPIYYRLESEDETLLINAIPFESVAEIDSMPNVEMIPLAEQDAVAMG